MIVKANTHTYTENNDVAIIFIILIYNLYRSELTPVVPWLSYSPLDPRFTGSNPAGVDGFFSQRKNPEYDFLLKGIITVDPVL